MRGLLIAVALLAGTLSAQAAPPAIQVLNDDASYPEGPLWYRGKLYYVEYGRNAITVWDGHGNRRVWSEDGCGPSAVVVDRAGDFLTTCFDNGTIGRFDAAGKTLPPYSADLHGNKLVGPNDFAPDAAGGFYFTCSGDMSHGPVTDGKVFYLAPDGTVTQKITGVRNANGIALSRDGKLLYVVETDANRLSVYDVAADGTVSGGRVFVNLDDLTGHKVHIWPDGVKIDSHGDLYIGQSPRELHVPLAGTIFIVSAEAKLKRTLVLPSLQVPNFAFSPDEKRLYVMGVDELEKPFRGKVYSIENR
jgi:sugar lactone lactonase YvrE